MMFSAKSFRFLKLAARQKKEVWLENNWDEYQEVLVQPMKALVAEVAKTLGSEAPGYRFPRVGFARIKSYSGWEEESGRKPSVFRDWIHFSASRDSGSRYESCPNLYFHFAEGDVYTAGGLYMPSADQTKHIRKWIDQDPSELEALLEDSAFKKVFKKGLGTERVLKTKPRDYPLEHPRIDWLKLSGWYVWRPIPQKQALSKGLAKIVIDDFRQVLRLNRLLDRYTSTWPRLDLKPSAGVLEGAPQPTARAMDF
jgi:uncharacterized protein (TIGR02453 family)